MLRVGRVLKTNTSVFAASETAFGTQKLQRIGRHQTKVAKDFATAISKRLSNGKYCTNEKEEKTVAVEQE